MIEAKDFLGKDLKVGDKVIFMRKNYRNFLVGYIEKITLHTCTIKHKRTDVCNGTTRQDHNQVIKVE